MEYAKYVTGTAESGIVKVCDRYHAMGISGKSFIECLERDDFYFLNSSEIIGEDECGRAERVIQIDDISVVYILDSEQLRINILGIF